MPAQASFVVKKPQVMFTQRLTDHDLHRLTVVQLRKKARENKLDVSLLSHKWEFIHVLVQDRAQGAQSQVQHVADPKRRTIFDLPGEIRNKIYSYLLVDGAIKVQYDTAVYPKSRGLLTGSVYHPLLYDDYLNSIRDYLATVREYRRIQRRSSAISQLRNMSWANQKLRQELRVFFFANN
ncbi:hypothetical protein DE146DRAFT_659539 [Phaeosphaeria sp. MPI-PUGE-AT-0046c]|nr:hypothetical protein DE146DRAFT_659539 [Phaeosphaeria sp. MPI-PUGE-AT-0046c]